MPHFHSISLTDFWLKRAALALAEKFVVGVICGEIGCYYNGHKLDRELLTLLQKY